MNAIYIVAVTSTMLLWVTLAEERPKSWPWDPNSETNADENLQQAYDSSLSAGYTYSEENNNTTIDEVIDNILQSNRQGRNLDGFDEVYSDPTVQNAIQSGDDSQARNLIKDKLCSLGLMDCEESVVGKRPFLPPGNAIYAQPPNGLYRRPAPPPKGAYGPPRPMPPPQNNKNFGPPRKVGYVGGQPAFGPPPGFQGPIYHSKPPGPIYGEQEYVAPGIYEGPKPPGPIYDGHKTSGPVFENPFKYDNLAEHSHVEHHENYHLNHAGGPPKPTIVVNAQGGAASTAGQPAANSVNIHHHYHHIDGEAAVKSPSAVIVNNPIPIPHVPVGGSNSLLAGEFTSSGISSHGLTNGGFSPMTSGFDYKEFNQISGNAASHLNGNTGFNGVNSGIGPVNGLNGNGIYGSGVKPVFETSHSGFTGSNNYAGQSGLGLYSGNQQFGENSYTKTAYGQSNSGVYNGNTGSFHSTNPGFYKKALNTNTGANALSSYSQNAYKQNGQYSQNNGFRGGQTGGQYNQGENYQGFESSRQENVDCVCVPYEQCPAHDILGRKDDLILPLDPRNLGSSIEALDEDEAVITDGNGTMTVVRVPKDTTDGKSANSTSDVDKPKKIAKRDVSEKKSDEEPAQGEGRLLGLGGINGAGSGGGGGIGNKKVVPTFGVSFGLPYPNVGYPLNPYGGGYPAQNPYFGSISPNGLNLGLVNVNPLVSFQVTKNEYGEKLLKPLVNLHVTPNENLIHKVGNLFKAKKYGVHQALHNQHYHTHTHYPSPPEVYYPHHPQHHGNNEFSPHYGGHYGSGSHFGGGHFGGEPEYYPHGPTGGYGFSPTYPGAYRESPIGYDGGVYDSDQSYYSRSNNITQSEPPNEQYAYQTFYPQNTQLQSQHGQQNYGYANNYPNYNQNDRTHQSQSQPIQTPSGVSFPNSRRKRSADNSFGEDYSPATNLTLEHLEQRSGTVEKRQAYYGRPQQQCGPRQVCCRRPVRPQNIHQPGQCGKRNSQGVTGRIKTPVYVDGDSEFGEYPWQAAILKKDPKESVYVCGGTLIDHQHIVTAAHCIKTYSGYDLRVRLGEWDVNHDVEFFPYIERDVVSVHIHPEYYAGTLDNDLAILKLNSPVDFNNQPHISPACMPDKYTDFTGARCWTTGWGKDAFGDFGKYQNILKEVDVPIINQQQCQQQLRNTRLGYSYQLNPGFICAGGEEGKDACKGDGGGPLVCERGGNWQLVGIVSWGIGCGQVNVPGVYVRVSHYLDWIQQITQRY